MKNITVTFTVDPNDSATISEVLHHYEAGPRDLAATNALLDFFEFNDEDCTNRHLAYLAACDPDRLKAETFIAEYGPDATFADLKDHEKRHSSTVIQ
jgi:hypothetical protein